MLHAGVGRIVRTGLYGPSGDQPLITAHADVPQEVSRQAGTLGVWSLKLKDAATHRKLKWALLRHAILGKEPFRFGAMIGRSTDLSLRYLRLCNLNPN